MTVIERWRAQTAATLVCAALGVVLLAGCDGDSDDGDEGNRASAPVPTTAVTDATTLTVRAVPLAARVVRVAGHLPSPQRRSVVKHLTAPVRSWLDGGFVAGDYPHDDFSAAFSSFTPGAARLARRQERVTTNTALGPDLVAAVPTRQAVRFSVFAPHGRAAGATAEVTLVLLGARADDTEVEVAVSGELYLTRDEGWRVFGFDLRRNVGAPGSYQRGRP